MSDVQETSERDPVWPILGWVLFAFALTVFLIAVLINAVMRAIVLDVVSFWPGWVLAAAVALAMWPLHRKGVARVGALAPLLLFSWLLGAVGLHFSGWSELPSASGDLRGPGVNGVETAELNIAVSGQLNLGGGTPQLYDVTLIRDGGTTGPAEALERRTGTDVAVNLLERTDAGWFASSGWNVAVSRAASWALVVEAGSVNLDLATIAVSSLAVVADGSVSLGSPIGEVPISVSGNVVMEVPTGIAVVIIGDAEVPASWQETDTGWSAEGDGTSSYLITVDPGATLVVEHRVP